MFAFMPVEKASTVHTTILSQTIGQKITASGGGGTQATTKTIPITAGTGGGITIGEIAFTTVAPSATAVTTVQVTTIDGKTVTQPVTAGACNATTTAAASCEAILLLGTPLAISTASNTVVITVSWGGTVTNTLSATGSFAAVSGSGASGATYVMS